MTSNGPPGGNVTALAIDPVTPATLYAGTESGVFKSTDGGGSWSAFNAGLTAPYVYALTVDPVTPAILYAGTNHGGVFEIHPRMEVAGLAATVTSSTVELSWTYAANDADHYEVWRAEDAPYFTPGDTCEKPGCATVNDTTYTDLAEVLASIFVAPALPNCVLPGPNMI